MAQNQNTSLLQAETFLCSLQMKRLHVHASAPQMATVACFTVPSKICNSRCALSESLCYYGCLPYQLPTSKPPTWVIGTQLLLASESIQSPSHTAKSDRLYGSSKKNSLSLSAYSPMQYSLCLRHAPTAYWGVCSSANSSSTSTNKTYDHTPTAVKYSSYCSIRL